MMSAINRHRLNVRFARAAALCLLALAASLFEAPEARAQWATNGNDIYNTNSGNVGVGTSTPGNYKIHVFTVGSPRDALVASFFGSHNIIHESQTGVRMGMFNNYHNLTGFGEMARQAVSLGYSNGYASNITGFYSRQKIWHNDSVAHGVFAVAEADGTGGSAGQRLFGGRFEAKTTDTSGGHNNIAYGVFAKGTVGTSTNLNHFAYGVLAQATAGAGTHASVNTYALYAEATNSGAGRAFGVYSASGTNFFSDNVGVGTSTPTHRLHVLSTTSQGMRVETHASGGAVASFGGFGDFQIDANGVVGGRLTVKESGNVGVGTASPLSRLHVAGDIRVDGNIAAKYQDVAEWVPSSQKLAAGMVVVLDPSRVNHVIASGESYDTKVAGVVSEQPGIILGEAGEGKVKVATTGRVKVRVDATRAPVRIGDLLVTSDVEGVAMKSEPLVVEGRKFHAPGTIIGKALEPLDKGTSEILVLLSLQ